MEKERFAYVVWVNSDLTEGRGYQYPKYSCETEATAKRLSHKADVQGSDARYTKEEIFLKNNKWYGPIRLTSPSESDKIEQKKIEQLRKIRELKNAAIDKAKLLGLSDEDIEALRS